MSGSGIFNTVGVLVRGDAVVMRGQVLAAPGSLKTQTGFKAKVYVLRTDEGGRDRPFHSGYKPQFYFRTLDVPGEITLEGDDWAMPGSDVVVEVELLVPIALEKGLRFAIREGGKTVGVGVVMELTEEASFPA